MNLKILFFGSCLLSAFLQLTANPRKVLILDEGWKFIQKDVREAYLPGFDDAEWESVSIPHDWAIGKPFDLNIDRQVVRVIADGEDKPQLRTGRTGALPAFGVGWYRNMINIPASDKGKIILIEFDGAMSNAQVYLNGHDVGEWPYGYSSFRFDITRFVEFGKDNLLAVRLENRQQSSRWYTGAGMYRNVYLVTTEPVHVGHWGTYITTPQIDESRGVVRVRTKIVNQTGKTEKVELVTQIVDPSGAIVATATGNNEVSGNAEFAENISVSGPMRWSVESPNMYRVVSKVYVNKKLTDSYETPFGFRSIRFDKDKGFFLNDEHMIIKGVCLHHTLGPLGAEFNLRATERQFEMLKEMGCNAIRSAHNPPSVEFLDLCDRMGFLVMDEAFDEWRLGKTENGYHTLFDKWAEKDMVAMIHRDRNHPSVILWSIGNEVAELGSMDEAGRLTARFLNGICHREDPTRPTVAAFDNARGAIDNGIGDEVDIFGINYPAKRNMSYAKYHAEKPDYCLIGSETNCTVSSRGVYKFPLRTSRSPWYQDYQLSSYDLEGPAWFSTTDTDFAMQEDCEAVAGEFVWTGFDYLGEPTPYNEGTPAKSSYIGIIDLAGLKKDRFYLYQSRWSDKPTLHLLPHWTWPDQINDTIPVMCYTNYPKAELFVNGKSMGIKGKDTTNALTPYRLVWNDIVYQPGEIKVVAMDNSNNQVASRVIRTAGAPSQVRLTPDRAEIKADGKDLCYITVEVLDKDGNLCPRANTMQFFEVRGAGKLKAVCNGDPTDQTSFASSYMKTFNGKMVVVVQSTKEAGRITLSSQGSKLREGNVSLRSK